MSSTIQELLSGYDVDALQTMAKFSGLEMDSNQKEAYVHALAQTLSRPDTIAASIPRLDGLERLVLEEILLQGGEARTDLLKQELLHSGFVLESPSSTYQGSPYRRAPRYFEDVLARLTAFGLVFSVNGQLTGGSEAPITGMGLSPGLRLVIPEPIRPYLAPAFEWAEKVSPEQIPAVQRAAPEAFQRDLFLLWSYIHNHDIALTSRGGLPKRHWMRINEELWVKEDTRNVHTEGDTSRLYFLRLLMEEMGLLERSGLRLTTAPGSRDFLSLSLRARTERVFRAWLRTSFWNELLRIRELHIDTTHNQDNRAIPTVKGGRQFVVGLLKHTPPDRWVLLSDLVKRAQEINYEFLFPRHHNYYGLHNPYHSYNNPLSWEFPVHDEARGWDIVEARFISYILQEPLYWMGLVSVGWEGSRLVAFRVSPLGAQILGLVAPEPEPVVEHRIIVQPNFEIFALDPVSDYTLSILDEFAERVKSEHVFAYHLTRESVYQAQQRGMTVQEITAFLDRESNAPLPQNVRLTLQEWGRYHERIVFFQGGILCQVAEPSLLDSLLADKDTAPLLGRRVSPTATLISAGGVKLQRVQRALQSKGVLPTLTPPATQPPPSFTVEADGHIRFRHRVADIYLQHELSPFTEERENELFITREAVGRAISAGWTAERIMATLRPLHQGRLAPEVISQIKVWGRFYGNAALKKVTLLQLKNADVLKELAEDASTGPLIVPFSPSGSLAIVRDEDVEALRAALREKGMDLDEQFRHA